jgi:hypothetical protein
MAMLIAERPVSVFAAAAWVRLKSSNHAATPAVARAVSALAMIASYRRDGCREMAAVVTPTWACAIGNAPSKRSSERSGWIRSPVRPRLLALAPMMIHQS